MWPSVHYLGGVMLANEINGFLCEEMGGVSPSVS